VVTFVVSCMVCGQQKVCMERMLHKQQQ
jgi:hypothetical protein